MHNFGKIKKIYNNLLSESIASRDSKNKKVFSKYVKTLKENKALKTQFLVYNNIENKVESDNFKINEYIKANISLLENFDKDELKRLNLDLFNSLPEKSVAEDSNLYESINTLIFTEKTPNTIDTIIDAQNTIAEHIKSNEPKLVAETPSELPLSLLTTIYVDKYNDRYSDLDESTFRLVKTILESDEEGRKSLFSDTKNECLVLVNDKLSEGVEKEKLLAVKEKLLGMEYVNENHVDDITDLIELKETLSE
jgi:hypothetical protein